MNENKPIKNRFSLNQLLEKLSTKFRVVFLDNESFEEKRAFVFSWASLVVYSLFAILIAFLLLFFVISFTSLKTIIPGYPDPVELELQKTKYIENAIKLAEFEEKVSANSLYYSNLEAILSGEVVVDSLLIDVVEVADTSNLDFSTSINDSLLRLKIAEREKYDISIVERLGSFENDLKGVLFFPPLKGEVTEKFSLKTGHNGIDVIASKNEAVKAVLKGTVVFSDWSPDNGHVIQIQHKSNLISIYKHNSFLLKKTGALVNVGDPIAIVGNSGSLSTGPHLHFELWYNGVPVDPEKFIIFE